MTMTLIDPPVRAINSQKLDSLELKNDKEGRADTSEFGHVMSGVMNPASASSAAGTETGQGLNAEASQANGQTMADMVMGLPTLIGTVGGDFLKAVHWGPHLNVITPETTLPDEQSLEAFARSQGLDETAVQWLMGTATPAGQGLVPAGSAVPAGVGVLSTTTNGPDMNALGLSLTAAQATPAALTNGVATPLDTQIHPNALNAAALWAMSQPTEKVRTDAASPDAMADAAQVQINLLAPPPAPAAIWMLRNGLSTSPLKDSVTPKTAIALSEIDLSQVATPELLDSLVQGSDTATGGQPNPLFGHSGHKSEPSPAAQQNAQSQADNLGASDTSATQRSEKVHDLAEKMGQAVGQRILSEIEKGQWHLKLSLRPATLGHIEVEMRMRSGEMDAVFTAPQALTRELLQEGLSKLKDTLNQMGMNVALMQVGDGQTRQRDGESTPEQMSKSTNTQNDDSTPTIAPITHAPRMKMGQDGWDVLV